MLLQTGAWLGRLDRARSVEGAGIRFVVGGHQTDGESPDPPPDQSFPKASISSLPLHRATGADLEIPGHSAFIHAWFVA